LTLRTPSSLKVPGLPGTTNTRSPHPQIRSAWYDSIVAFDAKHYWEQRLEANPGIGGVGYLGLGAGYNEALYRLRGEVFDATVEHLATIDREAPILDVGSGTGFYLNRWRSLGFRDITGSDLTVVATERLAEESPWATIRLADITSPTLSFARAPFAAVSAMDMLFHIVDDELWRHAVGNLARLVDDGGYLILSDHLPDASATLRLSQHQVSRTLDQYRRLIDESGMDIVSIEPMFVLMNGPVGAGRVRILAWRAFAKTLTINARVAGAIGRLMLPLERELVRRRADTHSTKIVVCRKRSTGRRNPGDFGA
jgi:2-polyprenyl-3-methyl-5-hydroxy-6-metoxy-1,4-benzoquinol methylase